MTYFGDEGWECGFVLRCTHYESVGVLTSLVDFERITPRRKDRSFAAVYCHVCRRKRRISHTIASTTAAVGAAGNEAA